MISSFCGIHPNHNSAIVFTLEPFLRLCLEAGTLKGGMRMKELGNGGMRVFSSMTYTHRRRNRGGTDGRCPLLLKNSGIVPL